MNLSQKTSKLRYKLIEMSNKANAAHLASALSCIDILAVIYFEFLNLNKKNLRNFDRDRFILSKGHAAAAQYVVLAEKGIIQESELHQYGSEGSYLEEHPSPFQDGIEAASGSLGHGLPIANGMALSSKISNLNFNVYVLMGDGECNEGSVWEGAMFASAQNLNNLTAIIDYNKWQATERSDLVLNNSSLANIWKSFGWEVIEVNGHSFSEIRGALSFHSGSRPKLIIANTIKGKGISFMEDDNNWHYRIPNSLEMSLSKSELNLL